jgi:glycine/D-amino acid oxidase-like deaminating enzyme
MNLDYDVIVVGGGTAGTSAAVATARRGHKVLLVEESNCLGGVSTAGGVNEWYASPDGLGDIFDRVLREMERFGARYGRYFNGEYLKAVWQLLAGEAGVEILFHTTLFEVERAGDRVIKARLLSGGQQMEATAKYFIDCSGEGDLCAMAGADFMKGHPDSGRMLHMSLTCILHDTGRPVQPYLPASLEPINCQDELPGLHGGLELPDGRVYCNMTKIMGEDATDPQSLSRAETQARLQMLRVVHYLQRTRFPNHMLFFVGRSHRHSRGTPHCGRLRVDRR